MVYGARAGDALDGRSVRRLLLIAYAIIFSGVQANAVARALSFLLIFPAGNRYYSRCLCSAGDHSRSSWRRPAHAGVCPVDGDNLGTDLHGDLRNEYRATSHVIWSIFESAFGWQEAAGGAAGYTLSRAITNGFQRSMFSNEAGMGSTPNAAAAAASASASGSARNCPDDWHFIDTTVICTASAMLILLAGNGTTYMPLEGIQLIQKAMRVLMGSRGAEFVTLVVILFAFSSIVANYIYAENNLFFYA